MCGRQLTKDCARGSTLGAYDRSTRTSGIIRVSIIRMIYNLRSKFKMVMYLVKLSYCYWTYCQVQTWRVL